MNVQFDQIRVGGALIGYIQLLDLHHLIVDVCYRDIAAARLGFHQLTQRPPQPTAGQNQQARRPPKLQGI